MQTIAEMRNRLLKTGYVQVMASEERQALLSLANKLKEQGHAVTAGVTQIGDAVVGAEAHHYLTCEKCKESARDTN